MIFDVDIIFNDMIYFLVLLNLSFHEEKIIENRNFLPKFYSSGTLLQDRNF